MSWIWFSLALIGCAVSGWGACELLRKAWRFCWNSWQRTVHSRYLDRPHEDLFDAVFWLWLALLLGAAVGLMLIAMALGTAGAMGSFDFLR